MEYKLKNSKKYTEAIDKEIRNVRKYISFLDNEHRTTEPTIDVATLSIGRKPFKR